MSHVYRVRGKHHPVAGDDFAWRRTVVARYRRLSIVSQDRSGHLYGSRFAVQQGEKLDAISLHDGGVLTTGRSCITVAEAAPA